MKEFNLVDEKLNGTHLIEASAGTGKTFTLAHLFLRLILERDMPIERILVVTFTEAATAELRERIHALLTTGLNRCRAPENRGNEPIDRIIAKDPVTAPRKLERALHAFDDAAICTIHGFCHRILLENAFETGAVFNTQLISDQDDLITEAAEDFWRIHCLDQGRLFTGYLLDAGVSLQALIGALGRRALQPGLHIVPHETARPDTTLLEQRFQERFTDARAAWEACREPVSEYLLHSGALRANVYRPATVSKALDTMERFLATPTDSPLISRQFAKFELFTTEKLEANIKKNASGPGSTDFFDACQALWESAQELSEAFHTHLITLKSALIDALRIAVARAKRTRHEQAFDDLLTGFEAALHQARGARLVETIRRRFKAALVDEFQDTDQIQYAIFSRLFDTPESSLFLIGDPKQAIYGFRGADVFTYMHAKENVAAPNRFTLTVNHRSSPRLVEAVNTVFAGKKDLPFLFKDIPFLRGQAAETQNEHGLHIEGDTPAPLRLWFLPGTTDDAGKPRAIPTGAADEQFARAIAGETTRLLSLAAQGQAHIDQRPLRPADIAVLVRKNAQALQVRAALASAGIPVAMHGMGSVFESAQAAHMQRILSAIVEPGNAAYIRAALATPPLGMSATAIVALRHDEAQMSAIIERFGGYNQVWRRAGFAAMIRRLAADFTLALNLLRLSDGERQLTDFNHLCELLQAQSSAASMGMQELLGWFARRCTDEQMREDADAHRLRLDSDENAVTIITIHRSKGLQYPVVFCPFVSAGSSPRGADALYHDRTADNRLTYDFGSADIERARHACTYENLAENIRLFYVALTRAKHRCYTGWGKINNSWTSAPAYLFYGGNGLSDEDIAGRLGARVKKLSNEQLREPLTALSAASEGTVVVEEPPSDVTATYRPPAAAPPALHARKAPTGAKQSRRISSFTSLVHHNRPSDDGPDWDDHLPRVSPVAPPPDTAEESLFAFPRGATAGTALHRVLELADFTGGGGAENETIVQRVLEQYRFEPRWVPVVCRMLETLRSCRLEKGPHMGTIERGSRLDELEFYFPLRAIERTTLAHAFGDTAETALIERIPAHMERLELNISDGFMHGFIDCVCAHDNRYYLIDWKSNYLGDTATHYGREHLDQAMLDNNYYLQYHIYAVALDRYLATRLPDYAYERHFGGVYYLFLRGLEQGNPHDNGIFFDRPTDARIRRLRGALLPAPHNGKELP